MRKPKFYLGSSLVRGAAVLLVFIELYSVLPPRPAADKIPAPSAPYRQGVIHVHSLFSDGGGTPEEIAAAAKKAGLDFVVLTDHNNSRARSEGLEKSYDGADLFVEMEAQTPSGHTILFYSHTDAVKLSDEAAMALAWQHFLSRDVRPGVFVATAHPSHVKNPWTTLDRFPDGMEAVNFDSVWQRELSDSVLGFATMLAVSPFNPFLGALRFFEVYPKDFTAWDGMNSVSKGHFAYLAHDTHAKIILNDKRSVRWPDYFETFQLASNVIYYDEPLATDFSARKKQLYESLRAGRLAMTYQSVYPFPGNDWRLVCDQRVVRAGGEVLPPKEGGCHFEIDTPHTFPYGRVIRLFRNGELSKEIFSDQPRLTIPLEGSGVYRVEVWARAHTALFVLLNRPVPYVFYNPIYVR